MNEHAHEQARVAVDVLRLGEFASKELIGAAESALVAYLSLDPALAYEEPDEIGPDDVTEPHA